MTATETKTVLAYHFLPDDKRLRYSDGREVKVGESYSCKGPLVLCRSGMHASERLIDALGYAPGPWLCRVECSGEIVRGEDKIVCRTRRVVSMIDATDALQRFAYWCADHAVRVHAPAALDAAVTALRAAGDTKHAKLLEESGVALRALPEVVDTTTADAARGAADAAWSAADAARGAADAAWSAARSAARSAASIAAWSAARSAADAARSAERDLLDAKLREFVEALAPTEVRK